MESSSFHSQGSNDSFGMDELCNFETHRMYASIDMHQGPTNAVGSTETLIKNCPLVDEYGSIDMHQEPAQSAENTENQIKGCLLVIADGDTEMGDLENAVAKARTPCKGPLTPLNGSLHGSPSSPLMNNHTQLQRSPLNNHTQLQTSPQSSVSEGTSTTTGYTGSTLSEDDAEDCDSDMSSQGVTLVDGRQFQECLTENIVLCINAGGPSIPSTSFGIDFSEDCDFEGGDVLCTEENITNTKDPSVYQTARYGNFFYIFQDVPPGDYLVDLHFAEIIFTNGPSGLRVFDVLVQDEKVVAKLDVYSKVGSNTPLILMNARALVKDKGLSISFRGIVGSPTINGICVRRVLSQGSVQSGPLNLGMHVEDRNLSENGEENFEYSIHKTVVPDVKEPLQLQVQSDQTRRQKMKSKARKCMHQYESKIQELKNEVHQAWISVQDANRQNEKLQKELDCRSFHVDSLAQAVEGQLNDLKDVKDKAENERQKWLATLLEISTKFQFLKQDYSILAKEAHEWVSSFPEIQSMTGKVQDLVYELEELKKKFVKQGQDLRLYYNQVLELKGNIRVFCRCRPLSMTEMNVGASSVVEFDAARDNELTVRSNGAKKVFKFDRVFTPSNNQLDVFMDTVPVVISVLDGYNVCIFAYGQTGTGKTFTMEGTENNRGVNYRTLEELFHLASERKGQYEYNISVSVAEVYNEQIRDLLASPLAPGQFAKKLEIKQVAEGVHHVPGLTEARVQCMEEVWDVLQTGSSARAVGSTNANEHSSRSHCMLCVMVKGESTLTGECTRSKLWLVDLAGSERVAKTDVQGERLKEAQSINKSLSALGDVIYALATKSSHVPYRNSKLTHLLQDSLGGESKTLMFVQISPSELDAGETLCSLNFASRVRGVELGPARKQLESTEIVKYKQMIEKSKQDGRVKDESLRKQEDSLKKLEDTMKMKEQTCRALSDKVRDLEGMIVVERNTKSTAECKLKEQQLLIEKLREELKTKDSCNPLTELAGQRRALEPVSEGLALRRPLGENNAKENKAESMDGLQRISMEKCPTKDNEVDDKDAPATVINTNTTPGKMKVVPSRYNVSSPSTIKGIAKKPGRASLCGVPRRRSSMAIDNVIPPITAAQPHKTNAMDSLRSSSESLQDSFPDENLLPHLQHSVTPAIGSCPKTAGWKKGASIAPSTVLRRSIPRKIHFKSPHLQPSYFKSPHHPPFPSAAASATDRDGNQLPVTERVMGVQKKRDQNAEGERQGVSKMRRVSIATTWGRPPAPLSSQQQVQQQLQQPWNVVSAATVTTLHAATTFTGVAQRVVVNNPAPATGKAGTIYSRERAWNR